MKIINYIRYQLIILLLPKQGGDIVLIDLDHFRRTIYYRVYFSKIHRKDILKRIKEQSIIVKKDRKKKLDITKRTPNFVNPF